MRPDQGFRAPNSPAMNLMRDGIPVTLISDTMVGYVMSQGMVDKVVVGADRIVRDAVLNKIGTYNVAVLAFEHGIPFYVAAPMSTMDQSRTSEDAVIEERSPNEVTNVGCERIAPEGVKVLNPAFDITPLEYVDAVITEEGILVPEVAFETKKKGLKQTLFLLHSGQLFWRATDAD